MKGEENSGIGKGENKSTGKEQLPRLGRCVCHTCVCQCLWEPQDGNSSRMRVVGLQGIFFLFVHGYVIIFDM